MTTQTRYAVRSPFDDRVVGEVVESSEADVRAAIARADAARPVMAALTAYQRGAILERVRDLLREQSEPLARLMAQESGKPIRYARGEAKRGAETFGFAADEARSLHGETVPLDAAQTGAGKFGYYVRAPIGVVAAITPFNFPLNLVAHKVAPAIAAGCPLVLKPNPQTPLTALRLAELVTEAGLPDGGLSVVNGGADVGHWLVSDPRVAMITFTGSVPVATAISREVGVRRATYELGGNAATVIDDTADLDTAVEKTVVGAFAYSGQVCISIQRIYVQRECFEAFRTRFVERASRLVLGDPLDDRTEIGPVINDGAASRLRAWIREAQEQGASVLTGGQGDGRVLQPTVLTNVDARMKVMCEEVFGPVVSLVPYDDFDDALAAINDSSFGLQAGIFTRDLAQAMRAVQRLDVGGVIINDTPLFRVDNMPYGGNRSSGVGREGPRFAIEDMTTLKLVVMQTG